MRVYLSAWRADVERVRMFASKLQPAVEVTYRWFDQDLPASDVGIDSQVAAQLAGDMRDAIRRADVFVFFTPPVGKGGGCWVELGLAEGKRVFCVGEPTSVFQFLEAPGQLPVQHFASDDDVFRRLIQMWESGV